MAPGDCRNLFRDLCNSFAPVPLDRDLDRFNRLLREMENSRPDDLARLFSSAKGPVATGQIRDNDEASSSSVLSSLQTDTGDRAGEQLRERLWQARLILKLAEILDRREAEVSRGLARIASDEKKIFASLGGTETGNAEELSQFPDSKTLLSHEEEKIYPGVSSTMSSEMLLPLRMKAWAELYLADPSSPSFRVLVTTIPDCASTLLDGFENIFDRAAEELFSISVPGISETPGTDHYLEFRNSLHLASAPHLEFMEEFLTRTTGLADDRAPLHAESGPLEEHTAAWEETIKDELSSPVKGSGKLVFYSFPGISPDVLLQRIFHIEPGAAASGQYPPTTVLASLIT